MLLGPCAKCRMKSLLPKKDDNNRPICAWCFEKHYSTKAKRENTIDRLLIDKKWWQLWK